MTDRAFTRDSIIDWVNSADAGRQAYAQFSGGDKIAVEDFLADETYVEKFLGLFASSLGYPGDGNWERPSAQVP